MGADLTKVPILVRREIEARVLGPLIKAFMEEFGQGETLNLLRPMIQAQAEESGRLAAEQAGGNSLADYAEVMKGWAAGDALDEEHLELSGEVFRWNVTRCAYAEMYQELGLAGLGFELSCARDQAMLDGFNPRMTLHRTKTIMEGDEICDFKVVLD